MGKKVGVWQEFRSFVVENFSMGVFVAVFVVVTSWSATRLGNAVRFGRNYCCARNLLPSTQTVVRNFDTQAAYVKDATTDTPQCFRANEVINDAYPRTYTLISCYGFESLAAANPSDTHEFR